MDERVCDRGSSFVFRGYVFEGSRVFVQKVKELTSVFPLVRTEEGGHLYLCKTI